MAVDAEGASDPYVHLPDARPSSARAVEASETHEFDRLPPLRVLG